MQNFIRTWELFHPQRDETFVSQQQRYVELHRPDGVPDIMQFIEHGTLNLVAQAEQIGHMASTLSNSVLDNYHHLGDAASITDGLHYDPSLKPYEVSADGKRSGTPDDMWAFTSRSAQLDIRAATMFAAASHALKGYNDDLAARALTQSKRLMQEATEIIRKRTAIRNQQMEEDFNWLDGFERRNAINKPDKKRQQLMERSRKNRNRLGDMATNLQLYAATGEKQYLDNFSLQIWDALELNTTQNMQTALDAVPHMDDAYRQKLRPYVEKYAEYIKGFDRQNPYGVPIGLGNWAGVNAVLNFGIAVNYAHIYFPDIVGKDEVYRVANWLYGCHPYHNYSFVAVVGAARPKQVFYGNNRADFSAIPGNVAPGLLFRKPDHFENYDDWPFLWGQNEGTIAGNTQYIIFGSSFKNIVGTNQ